MEIAVIGAGPIGCHVASLLAAKGHFVTVYEEHPVVGKPIQCTGLLTSTFDELNLPMDEFLVNTFHEISVKSAHESLKVTQKEYLVCRTKFDQFFANRALAAGAVIKVSHTFIGKEESSNTLVIKDRTSDTILRVTPDLVIAADGPLSRTAKAYDFYAPRRTHYLGVQAVVTKADSSTFAAKEFHTFFGQSICPDLFAWIVPENSHSARVGLGSRKQSRLLFEQFMAQKGFIIKEMQAGTIPVYEPSQKLFKDNCYLVGDAAGQVKATTLGGLVPGLKAAQILADCINEGKATLYPKRMRSINRSLWLHLQIRKVLDRFSDTDWDTLIRLIKQPRIQKILETYSRDEPIPLVTWAILKEPRFLLFARRVFF